ncbi:zinc finger CCCH domain-containing protein 16-like [Papaver somniferum]|uniref:zinc finger CCCH domain-containing protein 16-like n=1 Tax=Papaver somniferum TaxID=3469 RepID=UPI000E6F88E2|nr:zinc finger CCCH domain-containing protein 16-like [Papaver somniferum]
MNRKKELCTHFLRGSCRLGDRCNFLHANQQQSKPNPFEFGSQSSNTNQQQQKPNPFGFGTQSNSQLNVQSDFGSKNQNQFKPFDNKWNRSSSTASTNPAQPRKDDKQTQLATHKCTDPELCNRQIAEDFQQERPLWKLTCYGHCKDRPCDIVGDISYEEIRAAAYDDAKRGLPLPSIVERERNLLKTKILEFENLLRNPYVISNAVTAGPSSFPTTNLSAPPLNGQTNVPPTVSSFSQLGTSLGPILSKPAPPNMTFGQPSVLQNPNQNMGGFGNSNSIFRNQASGGQKSMQPFGSGNSISNFNSGFGSRGNNPSTVPFPPTSQLPSSSCNQSPFTSSTSRSPVPSMLAQASMKTGGVSVNSSIWSKEEWTPGEIPEEAPPAEYIY